jgi:hypothetical protein
MGLWARADWQENGPSGGNWALWAVFRPNSKFERKRRRKMEIRDITQVAYEMFRVKEDRLRMGYEDEIALMARKYEGLKQLLVRSRQDYYRLLNDVKSKLTPTIPEGLNEKKRKESVLKVQNQENAPVNTAKLSVQQKVQTSRINETVKKVDPTPPLIRPNPTENLEEMLFSNDAFLSADLSKKTMKKPAQVSVSETSDSLEEDEEPDPTIFDKKFLSDQSPNKEKKQKNKRKLEFISSASPSTKNMQNPERTFVSKYQKPAPQQERIMLDSVEKISTVSNESPHKTAHQRNEKNISKSSSSPDLPPRPVSVRSLIQPNVHKSLSEKQLPNKQNNNSNSNNNNNNNSRQPLKMVEVIRNKAERDALRGFQCEECAAFYNAQIQQGILDPSNIKDFLQYCSRHKAKYTPPSTPEGFWDLTLRTPDEWKK